MVHHGHADPPQWLFASGELSSIPAFSNRKSHLWSCLRNIQMAGMKLRFPQSTIVTAQLYTQRFYVRESLEDLKQTIELAATALFVAGKSEETPARLKDVVGAILSVYSESFENRQDGYSVEDAIENSSTDYLKLKERVLILESVLLKVLCFEMAPDQPHRYLHRYLRSIPETSAWKKDLTSACWIIINDAIRTSAICLRHQACTIGAAALFLVAQVRSIDLKVASGHASLEKLFEMPLSKVQATALEIAELYLAGPTL